MTKRHGLTAVAVENAKPGNARREIPDSHGLYLVLQPSGARSWCLRYRHGGKPRKLTLGGYPALSLAAARTAASKAREAVEADRDPSAEKRDEQRKAKNAAANTLAAVCRDYLAFNAKRMRSIDQSRAVLERHVFARL